MVNVIKRDATLEPFDKSKIIKAIESAMNEGNGLKVNIANKIADELEEKYIKKDNDEIDISNIETDVFNLLISHKQRLTAKAYEGYRSIREYQREVYNTTDNPIIKLLSFTNEELNTENSNKNAVLVSTQRDYMAGEVSKDLSKRVILPPDVVQAHEEGIIHFHDMDYFAQSALHNCDLINLEDMLQNGTVISDVLIEKPHSFSTACNIATQIIAQVASSQYGGQSISLSHLAPFVDVSRKKIRKEVEAESEELNIAMSEEQIAKLTEKRLHDEVSRGVQTIQYQVVTLLTTNGQAPFITVFMYLNEAKNEQEKEDLALIIEETLKQRMQGVKNEQGVWVTPAFPKLIYALEEDNITVDSPYYYLTELAAKCTAKRMVPDYISEKVMLQLKEGNCFPSMGCRSFLSPYKDEDGNYKFYGRFNKGVVTINLPDVALSSEGDMDEFWKIFEQRLELCHKALYCRYQRLKNIPSDVAPILWQHGALARLKKGETIDKLLVGGYSSISLGYAGLYECVKYLTKKDYKDDETKNLALKIMEYMNKKCDIWNEQENLGYSIYGSPIESTTYKFAKCLKKRFGEDVFVQIDGRDRNYITNSYHYPVFEPIDAFEKLKFESEFQELSTGGAISYVEVPNMQNNIPAVLAVIKYIYDNIMYAELNTKSDYCQCCGYDGEIQIVENEDGKLIWRCPKCGNEDQNKLNVARRTCGYIGTNFWNQGRTQEIKERVLHL